MATFFFSAITFLFIHYTYTRGRISFTIDFLIVRSTAIKKSIKNPLNLRNEFFSHKKTPIEYEFYHSLMKCYPENSTNFPFLNLQCYNVFLITLFTPKIYIDDFLPLNFTTYLPRSSKRIKSSSKIIH